MSSLKWIICERVIKCIHFALDHIVVSRLRLLLCIGSSNENSLSLLPLGKNRELTEPGIAGAFCFDIALLPNFLLPKIWREALGSKTEALSSRCEGLTDFDQKKIC